MEDSKLVMTPKSDLYLDPQPGGSHTSHHQDGGRCPLPIKAEHGDHHGLAPGPAQSQYTSVPDTPEFSHNLTQSTHKDAEPCMVSVEAVPIPIDHLPVDMQSKSDEVSTWPSVMSPSSIPKCPFSPEDVCAHTMPSPSKLQPPLNTENFPSDWPKRLTPTEEEVSKMFLGDYWRQPEGISELILLEEHQALIDHLVRHQKDAMHQTSKANALLKIDMQVTLHFLSFG